MIVSATNAGVNPAKAEREQLAGAARAFEAIFVRQMLASARKTDFGGELFGGQGLDTFRQMQDERFADIAAESGAFGIARMLEAQLGAGLSVRASTGSARAGMGIGFGFEIDPGPDPELERTPDSAQPEPVEGRAPTPDLGVL